MIPTINYGPDSALSFHDGVFAIEDSTLGLSNIPRQVHIHVVASGNTKLFTGTKRVESREGEILWWHYASDCGKFALKIFND